jgi:hypothetical protein
VSDGDRSDVAPKGIGFDLAKIAKGGAMRPSHENCPGALLMITREDYDAMVSAGEFFVTPRRDMPDEGRADARVFCKGTVLRKEGVGGMVYYGLCGSCSEAERRMREKARKRVETNGR